MATEYITKDADTFDKIAFLFYGDCSLFSQIINVNKKYSGTIMFDAGIKLIIPDTQVIENKDIPPWRR